MKQGPPDETVETLGGGKLPALLLPLRAAAHLLIALEGDRPLAGPTRHLLEGCDEVWLGRGAERAVRRAPPTLTLTVPDSRMSTRHARLIREGVGWSIEDLGSRNGVRHRSVRLAVGVPTRLADGDLITLGHTIFRFRAALATSAAQPVDLDGGALPVVAAGIETLSPRLQNDFTALTQMVLAQLPVLILGETGTGKEVLARALHRLTGRAGALIAVNCGALPPSLVERELFGHVRGAFSGATADHPGLIRAAHGGTLLLDEVGELPATGQTALLRVLQERAVTPIGAQRPQPVDFTLISATHRPLDELVAAGSFRADLLARLAGFRLTLPPLRERIDDLALLLRSLLVAHRRTDATFTPAAAEAMMAYSWPRNVRELEHALRAALALATDGAVDLAHLPPELRAQPGEAALDELGQQLTTLMTEHAGNVSEVARALGKGRTQIVRWLARYRLDPDRFRR